MVKQSEHALTFMSLYLQPCYDLISKYIIKLGLSNTLVHPTVCFHYCRHPYYFNNAHDQKNGIINNTRQSYRRVWGLIWFLLFHTYKWVSFESCLYVDSGTGAIIAYKININHFQIYFIFLRDRGVKIAGQCGSLLRPWHGHYELSVINSLQKKDSEL